jgi:hypothetical protein
MQPTRLPLQIQIENEDLAVVSAVLSGFLTGEVYALRQRTLQHEQEREEEEDLSGEGKYKN